SPTASPGRARARSTASRTAGGLTIRLALVSTPSSYSAPTASFTPSDHPRSSAFTISRHPAFDIFLGARASLPAWRGLVQRLSWERGRPRPHGVGSYPTSCILGAGCPLGVSLPAWRGLVQHSESTSWERGRPARMVAFTAPALV